jgi:hypothetical protein
MSVLFAMNSEFVMNIGVCFLVDLSIAHHIIAPASPCSHTLNAHPHPVHNCVCLVSSYTVPSFSLLYLPTHPPPFHLNQALTIHLSHPPGDILIFMTGAEDIEATCFVLADRVQQVGEGVPPLVILPIYANVWLMSVFIVFTCTMFKIFACK